MHISIILTHFRVFIILHAYYSVNTVLLLLFKNKFYFVASALCNCTIKICYVHAFPVTPKHWSLIFKNK